jgi:hypothetical protein
VIELLAPYHSGKRLPHHGRFIIARTLGGERRIILVGFPAPIGVNLFEAGAEIGCFSRHVPRQAKPDLDRFTGGDRDAIPERHFRALAGRIHRVRAVDDVIVDAVLWIRRLRRRAVVESLDVGLVLAEQQRRRLAGRVQAGNEPPFAEQFLFRDHACGAAGVGCPSDHRPLDTGFPGPAVAEPQCWQNVKFGRIRPGVT